jgi:hypothetical protein
MSLKDSIFAADDIPSESVDIPEWGVTVQVRGMSLQARERIGDIAQKSLADAKAGKDADPVFSASVVVATVFDPDTGEQVFTAADIASINAKSAKVVGRLADIGSRLSGLSEEAQTEAGKD